MNKIYETRLNTSIKIFYKNNKLSEQKNKKSIIIKYTN